MQSRKACRNIHDPKKIGSKPRQEVRRSTGVTGSSFLGQGNPTPQHSQSQHGAAGAGLQLVAAGGQLYLQQGGQVIQTVQPVGGVQGSQPGLQQLGVQGMIGASSQGFQPAGQGLQITQGNQFNQQQGGLGGWRI